ncbi:hypothetical protein Tco_0124731, partial [Tanacetum coccineum]
DFNVLFHFYVKMNKAISLGKGTSKVGIEVQQLSLKDCTCLSSKEITPQLSFNHLAILQARNVLIERNRRATFYIMAESASASFNSAIVADVCNLMIKATERRDENSVLYTMLQQI